ncbi:hypothetical protein TNCV_4828351 [Trichonephila clavipes]|uniref:Uncharacterized protein n=1 Tax=Trichonephila clavipes TaxID=2585209 RepID=A0A8X6VDQ5_TRICX|nr:hypothetical protein TNCV_4828351 [Trichonephila clavipes]
MSTSNGCHHMLTLEVMRSLIDWSKGSDNETATGTSLTYQELYSNARYMLDLIWRFPPTHQWYTGTSPGSLLEIKCDRGSQTALARLVLARLTSSHLKCLSHDSGRKIHLTLIRNAVTIQLHRITF